MAKAKSSPKKKSKIQVKDLKAKKTVRGGYKILYSNKERRGSFPSRRSTGAPRDQTFVCFGD